MDLCLMIKRKFFLFSVEYEKNSFWDIDVMYYIIL